MSGFLCQNPVAISEPDWKKIVMSCISVVSPTVIHFTKWDFSSSCTSLPHSRDQNSEENNSRITGQHEVGRKMGHITGIALGTVQQCPTSCTNIRGCLLESAASLCTCIRLHLSQVFLITSSSGQAMLGLLHVFTDTMLKPQSCGQKEKVKQTHKIWFHL